MFGFDMSPYLAAINSSALESAVIVLDGMLLILLAVVFVAQKQSRSSSMKKIYKNIEGDDKLDRIASRFDKCQITQDEYYRMKNILKII
jgi:uncharacterized membrane protein